MLPLEPVSTVAAYHRVKLLEIRDLYERLDLDLDHYTELERDTAVGISSLTPEFDEARRLLTELGAEFPDIGSETDGPTVLVPSPGSRYREVRIGSPRDFREMAEQAKSYLAKTGVDMSRDPLEQILGSGEVSGIVESYKSEHGDVRWDESDYLIVLLAGLIGTLLDISLVKIPGDMVFRGKMQQGSPLTKWIKENSGYIHEHYLRRFERVAKVPYDASMNRAIDGLSPKVHRLMSLGHDPVLGFIFGVMDVLSGTGTFIDKNGNVHRIASFAGQEDLTAAFFKVFLHLLSDVCTKVGLPPPLFSLLQLIKTESPFVLAPSGEKVSWTNVARYMYTHGYDLRHFATMGIVPATVEMTIRGWWLCRSFESEYDPELARVKLTSMLLLGHVIATSGNLLKTGVIYGMNPLALNWAQTLVLAPAVVSWTRESVKRDTRIKSSLDAEWKRMYRSGAGHGF